MKKFAVAAAMAASLGAYAAGPLDGIYSCTINAGGNVYQEYFTINGHPDGTTVYAAAAVSSYTAFYGYGIGTATSSSFVGNTMEGRPFNLSASATGAMSGTVEILIGSTVVNSTVSCGKIW